MREMITAASRPADGAVNKDVPYIRTKLAVRDGTQPRSAPINSPEIGIVNHRPWASA
jgi:hypothetical protein